MTITAQPRPNVEYLPAGTSVGPFASTFGYIDKVHLVVQKITADGTVDLVQGADYTVVNLADFYHDGGNITLSVDVVPIGGWAAGDKIRVGRGTPLDQQTQFIDDDAYHPDQVERMGDKLTRMIQEIWARLARDGAMLKGDPGPAAGAVGSTYVLAGNFLGGTPAADGETIFQKTVAAKVQLPANLGVRGFWQVPPADADVLIPITDQAGTPIGTVTVAQTTGLVTGAATGGTPKTLLDGSTLIGKSPTPADSAMADGSLSFKGVIVA